MSTTPSQPHVSRPHSGLQPIVRSIRQGYSFFLRLERLYTQHRAEYFFSHDRHRAIHSIEYRWGYIAASALLYRTLEDCPCTGLEPALDVRLYAVSLARTCQRAESRTFVKGVT